MPQGLSDPFLAAFGLHFAPAYKPWHALWLLLLGPGYELLSGGNRILRLGTMDSLYDTELKTPSPRRLSPVTLRSAFCSQRHLTECRVCGLIVDFSAALC